VIDLFKFGVLNFHGGDLPRYRGNACQAWAILNGEKQIGACVHRMVPNELDTGAIISRDFLSIDDSTKIGDVYHWMSEIAPELFRSALDSLSKNPKYEHKLQKQSVKPHRCHERRPEDSRIDWKLTASEIIRLINASGPPYLGAYCMFQERILRIFHAETIEMQEDFSAVPGQVIVIESNSVIVACGDNQAIRISKVSLDKGEISNASIFIKSTRRRLT
jgi:UDP-4-amino-4-deoxy-L-arabinose formyltransferase/UDP-glucuronic acid dehydrogenase (UDP-4-keto-hexauronic acid decarboxylating)